VGSSTTTNGKIKKGEKDEEDYGPIWTNRKDSKQYLAEDCVSKTEWGHLTEWIGLVNCWNSKDEDKDTKVEDKDWKRWKDDWEDWEGIWKKAKGSNEALQYTNKADSIVFLINDGFVKVKKRLAPEAPEAPKASEASEASLSQLHDDSLA